MNKILPEGVEAVASSTPLTVSGQKRSAMVTKAKALMDGKAMSSNELHLALENYYIFEKNEHYTSAQLRDVVKQVETDLAPEPEPIIVE